MKPFKNLSGDNKRNFKVLFITLFSIAILFASCTKRSHEEVAPGASLLVANAIPRSTSIDFYLDNQRVNLQSMFFSQGLDYFYVVPGLKKLDITLGESGQVLATDTATLKVGNYYSLFAIEKGMAEFVVAKDDLSNPPSGKAKIRFIHLSPDAPNIDIAIAGGATLYTNRTYKSYTDFMLVDPTNYTLNIRQTGNTAVKIAKADVQIEVSGIYTIMAIGFWNGAPQQNLTFDIEVIKHK